MKSLAKKFLLKNWKVWLKNFLKKNIWKKVWKTTVLLRKNWKLKYKLNVEVVEKKTINFGMMKNSNFVFE